MSTKIRSERLAKFLGDVLHGKQEVQDSTNFKRLVQAILEQNNPFALVEKLIANQTAMKSLRNGLRFNITPAFINEFSAKLILFLNDPQVKLLGNGLIFEQILLIILEPRTLWNSFVEAFLTGKLDENATLALCWLTTELLSLPTSLRVDIRADAQAIVDQQSLFSSPLVRLRNTGHKIKYLLEMKSSTTALVSSESTAGGRHDNDFADFRLTAILPTADEMGCTEKPFYRGVDEIAELSGSQRIAGHIDNQFRLLREDMLSVLRDDFQIANGKKVVGDQLFAWDEKHLRSCTIGVTPKTGLNRLHNLSKDDKKAFLKKEVQFVKHQAFGCLIRGTEIVAFATIERDIDALASSPPVVMLRIAGEEALKKSLLALKLHNDIDFLVVNTPIFAYEPILKCLQERMDFPLTEELFLYEKNQPPRNSDLAPWNLINELGENYRRNVQNLLRTSQPVTLDPSQLESLLAGLTQRVSLIQGPPGTGKSFIGALLSKALFDHTKDKILVMCYTNHALDQFLEDLLDIGIKSSAIVRLGSKSSTRTLPLSLKMQQRSRARSNETWNTIRALEADGKTHKDGLDISFRAYQQLSADTTSMLDYLEFEEPEYFEALSVPEDESGMKTAGKSGRAVGKGYLFDRWAQGKNPKHFLDTLPEHCRSIWAMEQDLRKKKVELWARALMNEQATSLSTEIGLFNKCERKLSAILSEKTRDILKGKRIIGCTTTAAAMYSDDLRHASPGIVLLEEAGEILESHVLTAIAPETKHLIMIGDHLQLKPKINNYALSAEKGDGYDLNVSLFERLIHAGYPHTTLLKQHRMCPEISSLVRNLTYPGLENDEKTKNRPMPRGLCDRVIFFNHASLEASFKDVSDRRDEGSKQSKQNPFEAEVVLKIVKYLGQQGYGTDKLVILTPYLGQLSLLRDTLSKQNDPVLNDLDSYDLVQAGLLSQASANHSKRQIKLSTIDNYQGEESEIVIASLTRSNTVGDIGFMAAPERLNVLLSRARNVLILVGNSETFVSSRKGQKCWKPLIDQLKADGHLYDGLPVKCEQHPQKTAILQRPEDFDREVPDGGCSEPCGAKLKCGVHECKSRCHQIQDHSKMVCTKIVKIKCQRNHSSSLRCGLTQTACRFCLQEDKIKERKRERDATLEAERQKKQASYAQQLAEAQDEAAHLRRLNRDKFDDAQRAKVLEQHEKEIEELKRGPVQETHTPKKIIDREGSSSPTPLGEDLETPPENEVRRAEPQTQAPIILQKMPTQKSSQAKDDWDHQKTFFLAQSLEIDQLMDMVGLESVKAKFLAIKSKVDTSIRQGVDLSRERFGSVLVGNPGTGKTTVARLYAKFLAAVGVIPGQMFTETTGSRLANDGISGFQKIIDATLQDGGGAIFIDEAYQLVNGNSFGGGVLDFLLAEVENQTGMIVFILAGYERPMEKFFSHNEGLPSRFPHQLKFEDFDDTELMEIMKSGIERTYKKQMKVDDGLGGLYCRVLARRIGRGRGREGFANARAVENAMSRVSERQSERLRQQRRQGVLPIDDFFFDRKDLIGLDPSQALKSSKAWDKLQGMIGLREVKKTVEALVDTMRYNFQRELNEQPLVEYSLNKVFLGNPGTGKTSIAKIYGQVLVDIGFLSNGEVVVKNPSDFVGSVIGESEKTTKGILAATLGKVLVIDEAYGLFSGGTSDGTGARSDPYRTAVVDTIVAEVQSTPGDDRCVLLLGYKDQMEQMFQNVNPGLTRRFPIDQAFLFEDFTEQELDLILDLKLKEQGYSVTDRARRVCSEMLERSRARPHFGNAGEIDILLNTAKLRHQKRLSSNKSARAPRDAILDAIDFDENFDRADNNETSISKMFEGVVGCESIVSKLQGYQKMVKDLRKLDMDPREQLPFNFVFRGPPGTGKTSTARKMGQVYYDMGLLASNEVIESSATDLVGQYVGQTGPKTQKVLERGLGKVLFIDEAYRLAEGHFAKEAMDELVDCITKPKFFRRMIIILAGYDADINRLMAINAGLTSRFPESLQFESLSSGNCIRLLDEQLSNVKRDLSLKSKVDFDITCVQRPDPDFKKEMTERFYLLAQTASWANARDVETLAKGIFQKVLASSHISSGKKLLLSKEIVIEELSAMINERCNRGTGLTQIQSAAVSHEQTLPARTKVMEQPPAQSDSQKSAPADVEPNTKADSVIDPGTKPQDSGINRDLGVTDEVWDQLERDKAAMKMREQEYAKVKEDDEKKQQILMKLKEEEERAEKEAEEARQRADEESRKRHEQARLEHELERRKQEAVAREIKARRKAFEEARRKEQANQAKLRSMGVCVMGYKWIKSSGGYRCAGGSHWVSDAQLQ
ncbi:uncharacterized protein N7506_007653 [Penicillium brevicompactum]|uniref:uncharacterized protein n=1 Tax=Penicillium brevicompactum TaxID=5074 RepID=UPI0025419033|nr:uncharacterized protein N7506_007653 [Penicillium brevicompactum]KAJ5333870.1 hypothetical protein N7506_007653 [Penicillium brevicompactum]